MRMSCNGCRVLRKGCSEECSIRPCLQWIKSPDQQANATLFLAKFYGRAGLLNLLHTGPLHLRPAIFRSLLYEACGRIVNPVHGSVGLLWSGNWHLCQSAVDAVLRGAPIDAASADLLPPSFDIRHVPRGKTASSARKRSELLDLDGVCLPLVAPADSSASSDGDAVELDLTLGFDRAAMVEAAIPEAEDGVDLGLELTA